MAGVRAVQASGGLMIERMRLHLRWGKGEARGQAVEMLARVGMPRPGQIIDRYAHQLSGGQRQRATIALALVLHPSLLIADEPTTALDVTTEAQILELLLELQRDLGMAMQYITHNLGVISELVDDVVVMYLGKPLEYGSVEEIFDHPSPPYTRALLRSIPALARKSREPAYRLKSIRGMVPDPYHLPAASAFHPPCPDYPPRLSPAPLYLPPSPPHP